uniref:Putative neurotoxin LTDF S-04 n=1 Tax=Dolomedes fimbriatus TaxID=1432569 RepID=A0A0K1D8Y0_9ARAC|nr:putative neurotoxin LTDF S-04 [Dolomedes fimbriatus]
MIKAFLLLSIAVAVSNAIVCPSNYCDKVDCEELTECRESNGLRIREKGSFCQCCDICVKVLGEGERCQPEGEFLGVIITSECAKDLVCDYNSRRCTRIGV